MVMYTPKLTNRHVGPEELSSTSNLVPSGFEFTVHGVLHAKVAKITNKKHRRRSRYSISYTLQRNQYFVCVWQNFKLGTRGILPCPGGEWRHLSPDTVTARKKYHPRVSSNRHRCASQPTSWSSWPLRPL
eukprot:XP_016656746.1 PREDICTED: uncharacterized protein LOC107882637 [Acyrthosiphon pisum]